MEEQRRCEAVSGGLVKVRCGLPEGHPEGQQYHCPDPNNPNAGWWSMTPNQCEETIVDPDDDRLYRCSDDKGHDGRHHIAETGLTWQDPTQQCDSTYEYPIGTVNQCEQRTGHTGHHSHVGAVWEDPRPTYAEQAPAQREETDQSVRDFLGSASESEETAIPVLISRKSTEQILSETVTRLTLLEQRLDRVLLGEAGERRAMQEGFEQQLQARASHSALSRTRTRLNQMARQFAELDERLTQLELQTGKSEMRVYGVDVSEWDQRWLAFEKTMAVLMERLGPPEPPRCFDVRPYSASHGRSGEPNPDDVCVLPAGHKERHRDSGVTTWPRLCPSVWGTGSMVLKCVETFGHLNMHRDHRNPLRVTRTWVDDESLEAMTERNANGDVVVTETEYDHPNGCPCGAPDPDASGLSVDMDTVTDAGGHWKS